MHQHQPQRIRTSWLFLSLVVVSLFAFTACGGGGEDKNDLPLSTAQEVKAAYDAAPLLTNNWFAQSPAQQGKVKMEYPGLGTDPNWRLIIHYDGASVYDKTLWAIYQRHGVTARGDDFIVVTEYESPVPGAGTVGS